jgi:hypothetical protein
MPGGHICATGQEPGEMAGEQHDEQQRQQVMNPEIRQLVKRRILTLRMRPKVAIVAMRDEPP